MLQILIQNNIVFSVLKKIKNEAIGNPRPDNISQTATSIKARRWKICRVFYPHPLGSTYFPEKKSQPPTAINEAVVQNTWQELIAFRKRFHCVKSIKIWSFSGRCFPVFGLNIWKYGPEKTPYLDTFHAVFAAQKLSKNAFTGRGSYLGFERNFPFFASGLPLASGDNLGLKPSSQFSQISCLWRWREVKSL